MKKISGMLKSSKVGVDDDGKYLSIQKLGFILKKIGVNEDDWKYLCNCIQRPIFILNT